MFLQQIPAIPKEYVDLLIWIIGISFSVIVILAGVIVYLHRDGKRTSETVIVHTAKTNSVLETIAGNIKDSGTANQDLRDSIKDLQGTIKSQNDYLPKIINALTGKGI